MYRQEGNEAPNIQSKSFVECHHGHGIHCGGGARTSYLETNQSPLSLDRKVICSPNTRAYTLLLLHAEVEYNISRMAIPSHSTPVPPTHDILVLHTRGPIWLVSEDRHLGMYFSSACQEI